MNRTSIKIGVVIGAFAGMIQFIGGGKIGFVRDLIIIPFLGIILAIIVHRMVKDDYISEVVVGGVTGLIVIILFDFFSFTTGRLGVIQFRNLINMINFEFQFIIASILTAELLISVSTLFRVKKRETIIINPIQVSAVLGGIFGTFLYSYLLLYVKPEIINGVPKASASLNVFPYFTGVFAVLIFATITKFKKIDILDGLIIGILVWGLELAGTSILELGKLGVLNPWHYIGIIYLGLRQTVFTAVITAILFNISLLTLNRIRTLKLN